MTTPRKRRKARALGVAWAIRCDMHPKPFLWGVYYKESSVCGDPNGINIATWPTRREARMAKRASEDRVVPVEWEIREVLPPRRGKGKKP